MKMKIGYFLCTLIIISSPFFVSPDLAQSQEQVYQNWSSGTAFLLPEGRMEIGIFQPLRFGWSNSLEFSIHPLAAFIIPNLSLKWSHGQDNGYFFASRHSIIYPTLLLRSVSKEGTGGLISPEFDIPHMISIYNEVVMSKEVLANHLLSLKAGANFALKSSSLDQRSTIDLPIIFPRLAVYYHRFNFRFGSDLRGTFFRRWDYLLNTDLFYTPAGNENIAFEHEGLLLWNKSERFQFFIGYKLAYGEYPYGTQWHLLLPMLDLQWARMLKKNR